MNVHGEVQARVDGAEAGAGGLAGSRDTLGVPICPVDRVFKQGQSKGMRQSLCYHLQAEQSIFYLQSLFLDAQLSCIGIWEFFWERVSNIQNASRRVLPIGFFLDNLIIPPLLGQNKKNKKLDTSSNLYLRNGLSVINWQQLISHKNRDKVYD